MTSDTDPDGVSFAGTRKALFETLERLEEQAREHEAEIIRRAEERGREIVAQAEERVAELDRQLATLRDEIDSARAALAAIRQHPIEEHAGASAPPAEPVEETAEEPTSPAPQPEPEPPSSEPGSAPAWADLQAQPPAADQGATSPQETLRALRAALEALNRPREGE